jgi:anti-anti-sigma regulatory factor
LAQSVRKGRDAGDGVWLLWLELMQWAREQQTFDEQAIDYAVTFEMSPPSWEPPPLPMEPEIDAVREEAADAEAEESIAWSGVLTGSATAELGRLVQFAQTRAVVPLDLSDVDRIDFVCAGALLNTIDRVESQRKAIQIIGASPIVRALLLLIGISPRHFVRKSTSA